MGALRLSAHLAGMATITVSLLAPAAAFAQQEPTPAPPQAAPDGPAANEEKKDEKKDGDDKKKKEDDVQIVGTPPGEDKKEKAQDYGGPEQPTEVGDVVVWPARVVLFPLWLIENFVLRKPIGALVVAAERGDWVDEITNFFTFGPRKNVAIFPSALFDFGLKPSVGFNLSWKYFLAEDSTMRLHFGTWGPDWIAVKASDTYDLAKNQHVGVDFSLVRRRDNPYSGYGPLSGQDDRSRYSSTKSEAALFYSHDFWRSSTFTARAGERTLLFQPHGCCGDAYVGERLDPTSSHYESYFEAPGFGKGYAGGFQRVDLEIDSRKARPESGSGFRLEGHEETVLPLDAEKGAPRRAWIKYGGSVGAAFDFTGTSRVLGLTVAAEFIDPLAGSGGDIPFPDQVTLGGDNYMPGYLWGRLYDRSSLVAQLQYRWPVWVYLDGVIHLSAGNVYGPGLDDYKIKWSRLSTGLGVRSNGERDSGFEILFAVGTDPLDQGFAVSSFRLVFGSHHGF